MMILVSCFILFGTSLTLIILKITQPNTRYPWLVAIGGGILGLISVLAWLVQIPFSLEILQWEPQIIFNTPLSFQADSLSWPYALSLSAMTLSILITAISRPDATNSYTWAGTLGLGGLGLLAVTANNPLTLLLVWGALDFFELIVQLRSVNGPQQNERVVIAFTTRTLGIGALIWGNVINLSSGGTLDFASTASNAGLYFILAAGLRLGVLPLHLPYSADSTIRRGFGTSLRLVSAVSSLALLAHIPSDSLRSLLASFFLLLAVIAAVYSAWRWLRAPDELTGRPYWIIATAALSMIAALTGNSLGAVAWGCALVLAGGTLFLTSIQHPWLNRMVLAGAFSMSAFPFSLTASTWMPAAGSLSPVTIIPQSMLIAGYIRHIFRPGSKEYLVAQPNWVRTVFPFGIGLPVVISFFLGWIGWDGAQQIGNPLYAMLTALLTFVLIWAAPRIRLLNPTRANWDSSATFDSGTGYGIIMGFHRGLERLTGVITSTLEGEGGIMWTLLFLVLFISLMIQGTP